MAASALSATTTALTNLAEDWDSINVNEDTEATSLSIFDTLQLKVQAYLFTFVDVSGLKALNLVNRTFYRVVEGQTLFPLIRNQFLDFGISFQRGSSRKDTLLREELLQSWAEASTLVQNLQLNHSCLIDEGFEAFCDQAPIPSPTFAGTLISGRDFVDRLFAIKVSPPRRPLATVCQSWNDYIGGLGKSGIFDAEELKIALGYVPMMKALQTDAPSAVIKWGMFLDSFLNLLNGDKIPPGKIKPAILHLANQLSQSKCARTAFAHLVYQFFRFRDPCYLKRQLLILLRSLPAEKRCAEAVVYEVRSFINKMLGLNNRGDFLVEDHLQLRHLALFSKGAFFNPETKRYNMRAAAQLLQDFDLLKRWTPFKEEVLTSLVIKDDWVADS